MGRRLTPRVKLPAGGLLTLFTDKLIYVAHRLIAADDFEAAQICHQAAQKITQLEKEVRQLRIPKESGDD